MYELRAKIKRISQLGYMMRKSVQCVALALVTSGCASTKFTVVGKDEYQLSKNSDACAVGSPDSVLRHLRDEAVRFCAGRREVPVETSATTEMGIPAIRCTSAKIIFRC